MCLQAVDSWTTRQKDSTTPSMTAHVFVECCLLSFYYFFYNITFLVCTSAEELRVVYVVHLLILSSQLPYEAGYDWSRTSNGRSVLDHCFRSDTDTLYCPPFACLLCKAPTSNPILSLSPMHPCQKGICCVWMWAFRRLEVSETFCW